MIINCCDCAGVGFEAGKRNPKRACATCNGEGWQEVERPIFGTYGGAALACRLDRGDIVVFANTNAGVQEYTVGPQELPF